MAKPKALVLSGDGINCENETSYALELADFEPIVVHNSELLENPGRLKDAGALFIPGGFSYGDEIASGKVLALKLKDKLKSTLVDFIEHGRLLVGICNGFQVLTQLGLLPDAGENRVGTLIRNREARFINKWVTLKVANPHSPFFQSLDTFELPIRHGEGQLFVSDEQLARKQAAIRYLDDVNGSFDRIAGVTNSRGNVLGLMPHPEAFVRNTQHPDWCKRAQRGENVEPAGLVIFKNARKVVS